MKESPVFSIIVPVYNTIRELPRCVQSVLDQTFKNYELLLIDDGSTDGSQNYCDEMTKKDSRILCIHKKNGGASEARNTGIQAASGKYLLFLDSDDKWGDENALKEIDALLQSNHYQLDVICAGVEIIDELGQTEKVRLPLLKQQRSNKKEIIQHLVYTNQYFSAAYVKIIRRKFVVEKNLLFDTSLISGEDIDWSGKILVECSSVGVFSSCFYKRIRRDNGSITSSIGQENIIDVIHSIQRGTAYIDNRVKELEEKNIYREYWAYQYAMLYKLLDNMDFLKNSYIMGFLKEYRWLLNYDHVKKVKIIKWLTRIFGISGAVRVVKKLS